MRVTYFGICIRARKVLCSDFGMRGLVAFWLASEVACVVLQKGRVGFRGTTADSLWIGFVPGKCFANIGLSAVGWKLPHAEQHLSNTRPSTSIRVLECSSLQRGQVEIGVNEGNTNRRGRATSWACTMHVCQQCQSHCKLLFFMTKCRQQTGSERARGVPSRDPSRIE